MTRLADVTGLTPFGVPVFQAIRPHATSVAVSQGKGLTPMAAMVSALLETCELHVAESLPPPARRCPLADFGAEAVDLWSRSARGTGAIRLDPDRPRAWLDGRCLVTGRRMPVPFDLVALDFTVAAHPDALASSSGLATGNDVGEAAVGAVGELLERDLAVAFDNAAPRARRAAEVALDSIDDDVVRGLIRRVERRGYDLRLWSLGDAIGVAAFRCVIVARGDPDLPPTTGSGCHPVRRVAAIRAVLEAIQVHATLIAGARDDLMQHHYDDAQALKFALIAEALSFDRGTMAWSAAPDLAVLDSAHALDMLLAAATARTALRIVGVEHPSGVAVLSVFRAVAPGLLDATRVERAPPLPVRIAPAVRRTRGAVVFIGPTMEEAQLPASVERLPPAVCGDLTRLLADLPSAVGLVDGCFGTAPSVWHKEILTLIALGVPVFGAGSLGALRAAELAGHGMIGVGRVFAAYRDAAVVRDDAVMLVHAPDDLGSRALTIALVDAETALHAAPLPAADRRILLRIVRTMPFAERTWRRTIDVFVARTGRSPPIDLAALRSVKHDDAMALVALLAAGDFPAMPRGEPLRPGGGYADLLATIRPAPR